MPRTEFWAVVAFWPWVFAEMQLDKFESFTIINARPSDVSITRGARPLPRALFSDDGDDDDAELTQNTNKWNLLVTGIGLFLGAVFALGPGLGLFIMACVQYVQVQALAKLVHGDEEDVGIAQATFRYKDSYVKESYDSYVEDWVPQYRVMYDYIAESSDGTSFKVYVEHECRDNMNLYNSVPGTAIPVDAINPEDRPSDPPFHRDYQVQKIQEGFSWSVKYLYKYPGVAMFDYEAGSKVVAAGAMVLPLVMFLIALIFFASGFGLLFLMSKVAALCVFLVAVAIFVLRAWDLSPQGEGKLISLDSDTETSE